MVNLLLKKWYEPSPSNRYHFSTLVQQTLSVIGQYGGVRANQLWSLLCNTGPFSLVDSTLYTTFLRTLGEQDLITQTYDGQLVLGYKGEQIVGHYTFYSTFNTPEEYLLECNGRILGTIPIENPLEVGQFIIFAGKYWEVTDIKSEKKRIILKHSKRGKPPKFGGSSQAVHNIVRQEMRNIYKQRVAPIYLDKIAKGIFNEGLECFHDLKLDKVSALEMGSSVHLLPWLGDQVVDTITALLRLSGLSADCYGGIIEVSGSSINSFQSTVQAILKGSKPTPLELANNVPDTIVEKYDYLLSEELRNLGYGAKFFDIDGAWEWLRNLK